MYFVYIIRSLKDGSFYTGITFNVEQRLNEHNAGKEKWTSKHLPYKLHYCKQVDNRNIARFLEKKLKSGFIREHRNDFKKLEEIVSRALSSSVERFPDKKEVQGPTP